MPVTHHPPTPAISQIEGEDRPVVEVENLSFSYHDGQPALRDVTLSIDQGEKVALVGPNGAGKSTLMLHLNGLLGDENSQITVGGMSLSKKNLPFVRSQVGLVFQNPDDQLFSPTVFDDVAFGPLHMGYAENEVLTIPPPLLWSRCFSVSLRGLRTRVADAE